MAMLNQKILLAAAGVALLASCGGGADPSQNVSGESDIASTLEDSAVDEGVTESVPESGWTNLQANWQSSIGSIKDQWPDLTEEQLLMVNGDKQELVSLVQRTYGLDLDSAEMEVNNWASNL